ncbi:MAG: AAA family ATPase [Alphaproteobacteria bacterium]|nr:AAA family ATPase [Alphaproteobacteria bacterium]
MLILRGARHHNLAGFDLDLPTDALVVVVGRSGSGKSSLAFDTLHAEGQRRYLEALSSHLRQVVGSLPRPRVDVIHGLPPTIALAQDGVRPGGGSTVSTLAEVEPVLRVLFGRAGTLRDPATGEAVHATPHDRIVEALLALPEGTRLHLEAPLGTGREAVAVLDEVRRAGFSRVRVDDEVLPLDRVRPDDLEGAARLRIVVDRIRVGPDRRDRLHDAVRTTTRAGGGVLVAVTEEGEQVFTDRPYSFATGRTLPELRPALFLAPGPEHCAACAGTGRADTGDCPTCEGTGLGEVARAVTVAEDWTLPRVWATPLAEVRAAASGWPRDAVSAPLLDELGARLGALDEGGLGHLTLGRAAGTLSAGELQRVRLARQVGGDLTGVLYVLDEPTLGLDDAQVTRLVGLLRTLRDRGNGLVVVEHHPAVVAAADLVVEIGPGPGREGGRLLYVGPPEGLAGQDTPTGRWLSAPDPLPAPEREVSDWLTLEGARGGVLRGDTVRVARGGLTALVGPSGAGKTLLLEALDAHLRAQVGGEGDPGSGRLTGGTGLARVLRVDEAAAGRSRRSVPATYVGLWDVVRDLLAATAEARLRGLEARMFSLNVPGGRCEGCAGLGVRTVSLHVLPDVEVPCEVCEGRRFARDVLEVTWKGRSAAALLEATADEALPLLAGHPRLEEALRALRDVGLGYLPLGQPSPSLSGGEARRLRLARELVRAHRRGAADTVFLLDEPTAGLHPVDVAELAHLLARLVDDGATVVLATHDLRLAAACDHVVALGPGVGPQGGGVVAQGHPEAVLATTSAR